MVRYIKRRNVAAVSLITAVVLFLVWILINISELKGKKQVNLFSYVKIVWKIYCFAVSLVNTYYLIILMQQCVIMCSYIVQIHVVVFIVH